MLHRSQTARHVLCLGHCSPTLCHRVFLVSSHLHLTGISPPEQTQGQHQRRHFVMTKVPAPPVPSIATRQSLDVRRRAFSRLSTCFDAVNWGSKICTQLATGGLCFRCRLSAHHVTAVPIMPRCPRLRRRKRKRKGPFGYGRRVAPMGKRLCHSLQPRHLRLRRIDYGISPPTTICIVRRPWTFSSIIFFSHGSATHW